MSKEPENRDNIVNLAELKRAAESIRHLAGRLIEAQEDERSQIGKELHDDICQSLAILAYELDELFDSLPTVAQPKVYGVAERVRLLTSRINRLSNQLHSLTLKELGLPVALRTLCADLADSSGIKVQCRCMPAFAGLDDRVALTLFRTAQEALQNVRQHSQAHQVEVDLTKVADEVLLRVSDDGVGFDPKIAKLANGLGFVSMEERLQSIGGSLLIRAIRGHGTTIEARSPITTCPATPAKDLPRAEK